MNFIATSLREVWCLVRKDLRRESRAPLTWPAAVLLGVLLLLALDLEANLPSHAKQHLAGGWLWLAVFLAGTLTLGRAFDDEQQDGCWDALRMYPVPPARLFVAKMLFNFLTLCGLTIVLSALMVILADVPLMVHPGATLAIVLLANLGLAAIGTLIGALTSGVRRRGNLLALVLFPLVLPVLLGAGEATRLVIAGDLGNSLGQWLQLLAAFALMFGTLGMLIFPVLVEE